MELNKEQFPPGKYLVKVSQVLFGFSEVKRIPYIALLLEADKYLYVERMYLSGNGIHYTKKLLSCFKFTPHERFKSRMFDIQELVGQEINLDLDWKVSYNNGKQYKRISITKFEKYESEDEFYSQYDINLDDAFNEKVSMTEIFGGDLNDIAESMGKHPSDVTDEDVREYNGY